MSTANEYKVNKRPKDAESDNEEEKDKSSAVKSSAIKSALKNTAITSKSIEIDINTTKISDTYDTYILILGRIQDPSINSGADNPWVHLSMDGTFTPISTNDNTIDWKPTGFKYANYSLNLKEYLKENGSLTINTTLFSARLFISYDKPLLFHIDGPTSYAGPSMSNPSVPGFNIIFDKVEFTFNSSNTFFCNLTQVDFFSIPMTMQLDHSHIMGIQDNQRQEIFAKFSALQNTFWSKLLQSPNNADDEKQQSDIIRVISPNQYLGFPDGEKDASTFWDNYINSIWTSQQTIQIKIGSNTYTGNIVKDILTFNNPQNTQIAKPTTAEVWGCNGVFIGGGDDGTIKTAVSAAINRAVALNYTENWDNSKKFYVNDGIQNHYAYIMHEYNINHVDNAIPQYGASYAFPYDDYPSNSVWDPEISKRNPKKLLITLSKF